VGRGHVGFYVSKVVIWVSVSKTGSFGSM
jgi:hypothetical protein